MIAEIKRLQLKITKSKNPTGFLLDFNVNQRNRLDVSNAISKLFR